MQREVRKSAQAPFEVWLIFDLLYFFELVIAREVRKSPGIHKVHRFHLRLKFSCLSEWLGCKSLCPLSFAGVGMATHPNAVHKPEKIQSPVPQQDTFS